MPEKKMKEKKTNPKMPEKKMKEKKTNPKINEKNNVKIIIITIILLLLLVILTRYNRSSDIGDYTDVAKFFAGNLQAKLRTSHPVAYSLIHVPFVKLAQSFLPLKISSVLWLSLLILSVYYISNKNRKTLLLFITTPAFWFMAPWIGPVQLAALLFLWAYFFINKYDELGKLKYLVYSGLLIGFAWIFWEAVTYFAVLMIIVFLYNKKTSHFFLFILMLFMGVIPKLIIDYVLFGFPFYSIAKHFFSVIAFSFYGSIYGQTEPRGFFILLPTLLMIPIYIFILFTKKNFKLYKREVIFVLLAVLTAWVAGSQIRYIFVTIPIIILLLGKILTPKQFKIQLIIFLILSLIVINPYLIQIKYETNAYEYPLIITKLGNLKLNPVFTDDIIKQDLNQVSLDYPSQSFIVGNGADTYQVLADIYWGKEIQEFVSIQDYNLFLQNSSIVFSKTICSASPSWNRRDICISASLNRPVTDNTDYESINYALTIGEDLVLENFKLINKYQKIWLFEKEIKKEVDTDVS